jgi:hypothetical protein
MRRNFLFPTARPGLIASLLKKYEEINIKRFRLNGRSSRAEKKKWRWWNCIKFGHQKKMSKEKRLRSIDFDIVVDMFYSAQYNRKRKIH